jgi:hypothetical protein
MLQDVVSEMLVSHKVGDLPQEQGTVLSFYEQARHLMAGRLHGL